MKFHFAAGKSCKVVTTIKLTNINSALCNNPNLPLEGALTLGESVVTISCWFCSPAQMNPNSFCLFIKIKNPVTQFVHFYLKKLKEYVCISGGEHPQVSVLVLIRTYTEGKKILTLNY